MFLNVGFQNLGKLNTGLDAIFGFVSPLGFKVAYIELYGRIQVFSPGKWTDKFPGVNFSPKQKSSVTILRNISNKMTQ